MARCRGEEETTKSCDEGEVDPGGKVPEGSQVARSQAVDEVHGGYQASFGGRAADVGKVDIGRSGTQGADDAAVKGYLGGEVGQM